MRKYKEIQRVRMISVVLLKDSVLTKVIYLANKGNKTLQIRGLIILIKVIWYLKS